MPDPGCPAVLLVAGRCALTDAQLAENVLAALVRIEKTIGRGATIQEIRGWGRGCSTEIVRIEKILKELEKQRRIDSESIREPIGGQDRRLTSRTRYQAAEKKGENRGKTPSGT